jgi:predicted membrane channel-forming protein YqfA (hemolysin III family)
MTTVLAGSLSPAGMEIRRNPETGNAFSATTTTVGGLLAICWQPTPQRGRVRLFVLVGVTGIEPVTSAV